MITVNYYFAMRWNRVTADSRGLRKEKDRGLINPGLDIDRNTEKNCYQVKRAVSAIRRLFVSVPL